MTRGLRFETFEAYAEHLRVAAIGVVTYINPATTPLLPSQRLVIDELREAVWADWGEPTPPGEGGS